jgi:sugar phosphate isomerase/epimerase
MQLGLHTYSYHLAFGCHPHFQPRKPINIFDFIDRVVEFHLDGFQIDPLHLESNDPRYLEQVRRRIENHDLFVAYGASGLNPVEIERGVDICRALGAEVFRTSIGFDRSSPRASVKEELKTAKLKIQAVLGLLEKSGVKLALENHGDVTSNEMVELVEELDSPHVGICLDVGDSVFVMEDPLQALLIMLPHAFLIHFKDYGLSMTQYGCKICGTPLGRGILPLKEMLHFIRMENTVDRLILEIPVEAEEDETKTLKKEDQAVRESVAFCDEALGVRSLDRLKTGQS